MGNHRHRRTTHSDICRARTAEEKSFTARKDRKARASIRTKSKVLRKATDPTLDDADQVVWDHRYGLEVDGDF